jgi:hypothetical protein
MVSNQNGGGERIPALFLGADFSDPKNITDPNFDPRAYEDYLEDDILRKVEAFK